MNRCNRIMKKQEGKIYRTPENPTLVCMRWFFFFNGKKIRRQACCEICYFHAQLHVKIIGIMRQIMRATPYFLFICFFFRKTLMTIRSPYMSIIFQLHLYSKHLPSCIPILSVKFAFIFVRGLKNLMI